MLQERADAQLEDLGVSLSKGRREIKVSGVEIAEVDGALGPGFGREEGGVATAAGGCGDGFMPSAPTNGYANERLKQVAAGARVFLHVALNGTLLPQRRVQPARRRRRVRRVARRARGQGRRARSGGGASRRC